MQKWLEAAGSRSITQDSWHEARHEKLNTNYMVALSPGESEAENVSSDMFAKEWLLIMC